MTVAAKLWHSFCMDEYGIRTPLPSDEWRKSPSKKKDTKRWCRGHVGREHVPEIRLQKWPYGRRQCHAEATSTDTLHFLFGHDQHGFVCYHEVVCSVCSKRLEYTPERCPENTLP